METDEPEDPGEIPQDRRSEVQSSFDQQAAAPPPRDWLTMFALALGLLMVVVVVGGLAGYLSARIFDGTDDGAAQIAAQMTPRADVGETPASAGSPPAGSPPAGSSADGPPAERPPEGQASGAPTAEQPGGVPSEEAPPPDGGAPVPVTSDDAAPVGPVLFPYGPEDYGVGVCAPVGGVAEAVLDFSGPPGVCIDFGVDYRAIFDTSAGVVVVDLDVAGTPGTVNSFVNLARFGYYDGTLIHRSDPSIGILQGGSPHTDDASDPGPGYRLWDEGSGFTYRPGLLAMARTTAPDSADAQWFFTVTEAAALLDDQGIYVVFGEVVEGLDVLEAILAAHVDEPGNDFGGAPDPPVTLDSVTIEPPVGAAGAAATPGEAPGEGAPAGQSDG